MVNIRSQNIDSSPTNWYGLEQSDGLKAIPVRAPGLTCRSRLVAAVPSPANVKVAESIVHVVQLFKRRYAVWVGHIQWWVRFASRERGRCCSKEYKQEKVAWKHIRGEPGMSLRLAMQNF